MAKKINQEPKIPQILIVDDVVETLELIKIYIESFEKVNVVTCTNGQDALEAFSKIEFALILLDVDMPKMDGFELARKMREFKSEHQIPIIYITGCDREGKRANIGYEVGAVDYILKPINMEFLLSKVRVFVNLYHQKKGLENEISKKTESESELKKANQNIKSIIDGVSECVCAFNKIGNLEAINAAGLHLLGMSKNENILGSKFSQWVLPSDKATYLKAFKAACLGKEVSVRISLQTVKNEIRTIDLNIVPFRIGKEIKKLIGLAIDITEKENGRSNKNKSALQLPEQNLELFSNQFVSNSSNESDSEIEEKVRKNVTKILKPMVERLKKISPENKPYFDLMSSAMNGITNAQGDDSLKEFKNLTCKEIELYSLFKKGLTNKEISKRLNKSERNISLHLSKISLKLGLVPQ